MHLAIVATHPVQYNSPWFRMLKESHDVDVRVFYTWHAGNQAMVDPGFGKSISWDIPLTDGYSWEHAAPSRSVTRRTFWNMDSPELLERIKRFSPDAVLVIGWNYRSHLRVMRYFHGRIPVLFRGDSTLLNCRNGLREQLRTTVLRSVYRSIDYALSVGSNNTDYFLHHGLKQGQIVCVPHAIDNLRFSGNSTPFDLQAADLRAQLGFSEQQIVLLFAGKFERVKALDRLIRAYRVSAQQRSELRLLIVGSGPLESTLRADASDLKGIVFLPFQNQSKIPVVYRVGDLTVLPSISETWGLCLNESMASGRPVMASNHVGASRDLVRQGVTGFEFASSDQSLVESLIELPRREKLQEMGAHCQAFIGEWSFDVICSRITGLLRSLKHPIVKRSV